MASHRCSYDRLFRRNVSAGLVFQSIQSYKDVGFKTYSELYYSCVVPVLDYCSGVWGLDKKKMGDLIKLM